ncbi:MAG: tRNA lysidine(34) synthetase TilS [Actinomycetota bacterium]|nr:tRNA lysidine(34) synthetase TilS [Actinomycetota bacterium]
MSSPSLAGPGYELVVKVRSAIERWRMLGGGETVVVAVSGGPDSTCLLDVLMRLSGPLSLHLEVAHVDHGLQEGSADIAARVGARVAEAGLDAHVVRLSGLEGGNVQARARTLRYAFFETLAQQLDAQRIATGHTLDDRVETTLGRLIHGAAPEVLAGIPPRDGLRIRPLIGIRRSDARAYCEERGLSWHDDPANDDDRFERVAVRTQVVPVIERRWGPGAVRAMATSCERLWEDAQALENLAERIYAGIAESSEGGVSFERSALGPLDRALRRRLLQLAVGRVRDRSGGIEAALDALDGQEEATGPARDFAVTGKGVITVSGAEVRVARIPPAPST